MMGPFTNSSAEITVTHTDFIIYVQINRDGMLSVLETKLTTTPYNPMEDVMDAMNKQLVRDEIHSFKEHSQKNWYRQYERKDKRRIYREKR